MRRAAPIHLSRDALPTTLRGGIVALGNFDGFHLGHQAVVGQAVALARAAGLPALVATFDPHPVRWFRPDAPPFRLTTLDQRAALFAAAGADATVILPFDAAMAATGADAFVARWIIEALGAGGVVTGDDFGYGHRRSGDTATLAAAGAAKGFATHVVRHVDDDGQPVSSSRVRNALAAGDCATATRLLTRPFAIAGIVQHGDKNGRRLGYPTANLDMGDYQRPAYGIYAVTGRLSDGRMLKGAANVGVRPSFDPPKELLEPHFLDFDGDLYGQPVEVAFHHFLRPEARFDDMDALMAQMARDCDRARSLLAGA